MYSFIFDLPVVLIFCEDVNKRCWFFEKVSFHHDHQWWTGPTALLQVYLSSRPPAQAFFFGTALDKHGIYRFLDLLVKDGLAKAVEAGA